jgi:hypothetical protein
VQGLRVDGFDGVKIDDPGVDPVFGRLVGSGEAFVQGHSGTDKRRRVIGAGAVDFAHPERGTFRPVRR